MLTFKDGVLYYRNVDAPNIPTAVVTDVQAAYNNYVKNRVYEDMDYFLELLHGITELSDITLKTELSPVSEHTVPGRTHVGAARYIPVNATFSRPTANGQPIRPQTEIFRIPAMHDFGKFNFEGKLKTVISQIRSADSFSFDEKKSVLNITMPKVNLRIKFSHNRISLNVRQRKIDILPVLLTMLQDAEDFTPIGDYIKNSTLRSMLKFVEGINMDSVIDSNREHENIHNSLRGDIYKLGEARVALNTALSLDRGLGCTLSEDCMGYKSGYVVDQSFIDNAYANRINHYVVRNEEFPDGYLLAQSNPIVIARIPKGTKNCPKLRVVLPEYNELSTIPDDITLFDNPIIYEKNQVLSRFDMELLYMFGHRSLELTTKRNAASFIYSMDREIIGNSIAPLYKLTKDIPADRDANEMIYYHNNPDLHSTAEEIANITAHDLLAIVSLIGEIAVRGNTRLYNRDTAFLKKLVMVDDLFSESLRATMREFIKVYRRSITDYLNKGGEDASNPFAFLTNKWYSYMVKNKITSTIDANNLCAEISQACRINTPDNGSGEILDEQRYIATLYYGRICPFETPAGFKLGAVNTRALGSKVENGVISTPYRKVLAAGDSIRISDNITWLTPDQEFDKKFGDLLSLRKDASGRYINNKVFARIPNPDRSGEPFIFKNIDAFDLIGNFVQAYPEQTISPIVALVPFLGADNSIRTSYGISQIKQGVLLNNSQKSKVRTPMHYEMFDFYNKVAHCSPCNGTVVEIQDNIKVVVKADSDGTLHTIDIQDVNHSQSRNMLITYRSKVGDHVRKDDVLCEGTIYPQDFIVRSPASGYVKSIDHQSITIVKNDPQTTRGRMNLEEEVPYVIPLNAFRQLGNNAIFLNLHVHQNQRVSEGQILADTCTSRDGVYTPARCPLTAIMSTGYNYEDGVHTTERASIAYTSLLATTLHHRNHRAKETAQSLDVPCNFRYNTPGDTVTRVTRYYNAESKREQSKIPITATLTANGIYYHGDTVRKSGSNTTDYYLSMLSFNKLKKGDKCSGMHGNKGVISYVQKDSEAPQLSNGKIIEMLLGPCGIPSRMNYGQMFEMHSSLAAEVLSITIDSPSYNGATSEEVDELVRYAYMVANNVDPANKEATFWAVASAFPGYPKELHEHVLQNIDNALDWAGVFDEEGKAEVYDSELGEWFHGKAVIGFPTFNKLMQESDEKLRVRSGPFEEEYSLTNGQPQESVTSTKGQRVGEMEFVNYASLGAAEMLRYLMNEGSDNVGMRTNALLDLMLDKVTERTPQAYCSSRATDNLLYLLAAVGVHVDLPDEVKHIDSGMAMNANELSIPRYLHQRFADKEEPQPAATKTEDFGDVKD